MEVVKIVVEGVSEEQVMRDIERNLRGWKLLLQEPKGVSYEFMNPFFGHTWDGTAEDLLRIIKIITSSCQLWKSQIEFH